MPTTHPSSASLPPALTVYYDGSCPLCQREIALDCRNPASQAFAWVDVSQPAALGEGLNCAQAMARFHVRTADGHLFDGAAAFSQLWRRLPGWRPLGWVSAVPPISWLSEGLYRAFLPLRPRLQRWVQRRWGVQR